MGPALPSHFSTPVFTSAGLETSHSSSFQLLCGSVAWGGIPARTYRHLQVRDLSFPGTSGGQSGIWPLLKRLGCPTQSKNIIISTPAPSHHPRALCWDKSIGWIKLKCPGVAPDIQLQKHSRREIPITSLCPTSSSQF